jgi:integral membrane protein
MTVARFRVLAAVEAVTWMVMIGAVVAKRGFGVEQATALIGPVHGIVFLAYLAGVVFLREELQWSFGRTTLAIVAAVIPAGAYLIVDRHLLSSAPTTVGARSVPNEHADGQEASPS